MSSVEATAVVSKFVFAAASDGIAAEVRINDIPLFESAGAPASLSLPLNHFLVEGTNRIVVKLEGPSDGTPPPVAPEPERLRITIHENDLLVYILVYPPALEPPGVFPAVEESEFLFDVSLGRRPWECGAPLDPAGEPSGSMLLFLKKIEQALSARQLDEACRFFETRARDRAAVFGLDAGEALAEMRKYFAGLFRDPFWGMAPFAPSESLVRICGGGRIAFLKTRYGEDPLRSIPDAEGITTNFPVAVSQVDGEWTIVL
jgi:hypothetical protein